MKSISVVAITITASKIIAVFVLLSAIVFDAGLIIAGVAKSPATMLAVLPWAGSMILGKQGFDAFKTWAEHRPRKVDIHEHFPKEIHHTDTADIGSD